MENSLRQISFDVFKREFPICDVARGLIGDPLIVGTTNPKINLFFLM